MFVWLLWGILAPPLRSGERGRDFENTSGIEMSAYFTDTGILTRKPIILSYMYTKVYTYVCMCVHRYVYIYIYIYRERERERYRYIEREICIHSVYIYIYI